MAAAIEHAWEKTNPDMTDHYECQRCGVTGKRQGLSWPPLRDRKYAGKNYDTCPPPVVGGHGDEDPRSTRKEEQPMRPPPEGVTEVRKRDQAELPGVRPKHMKRLEDIEEDIRKNEGKIAHLRKENRELSDEAVSIYEENKLVGTRVNGPDEWYIDEGQKKYKHRRFKDSKEEAGKGAVRKGKKASA